MNRLQAIVAVTAITGVLACAQPAGAAFYREVGDAGGLFDSQRVGPAGMEFDGISGNIGDGTDTTDAFAFFFAGGALYARTLKNLDLGIFRPLEPHTGIWDIASGLTSDPKGPPGRPLLLSPPIYINLGTGVVGWNLLAGNYIIELLFDGSDPPYSSTFFTINPDASTNPTPAVITAPQPIPEPATAALLALGLAGLAAARRRRGPKPGATAGNMA